jgi:lysophospholipase L1-like esterase
MKQFKKLAKYLNSNANAFAITVFIVIVLETVSWIAFSIYSRVVQPLLIHKNLHIGSINPMYLKDEQISLLYGTTEPEIYRQVLEETWGGTLKRQYEPFVEHTEKPVTGKWVNVTTDGYRKIEDQFPFSKERKRLTIYVFGGSTTFGYGVKDSESIPSALQKLLREKYNKDVSVYNFGSGSYYSTLERIRFEKLLTSNHIPDIVIFIDGLNDLARLEFPDKSEFSKKIAEVFERSALYTFLIELANSSNTVNILKLFSNNIKRAYSLSHIANLEFEIEEKLTIVQNRLFINHRLLLGISKELGILPIFVIQPTPFFNYDNSLRAVPVPIDDTEMENIFTINKKLYKYIENTLNLNNIRKNLLYLGNYSIEENQYIDRVHYSPVFNKKIADEIAKFIITQEASTSWPEIN